MDTIAMTQFGMDVDPHNNPEAGFVKNAKTAMSYVTSPILMLCGK